MNRISLILFILFASCNPRISEDFQLIEKTNICELVNTSFTIDSPSYGNFATELNEFLSSANNIDILLIKIRGGHPESNFLKRWIFKTNAKLLKKEITFSGKYGEEIEGDFNILIKDIEQVEQGSYIQLCRYTSSNISYLQIIKINGVIKFQYSSPMISNALDRKSKNKIQKFISTFSKLKSM